MKRVILIFGWILLFIIGCDTTIEDVEEMMDQEDLIEIALNSEREGIREKAVNKLTDQEVLAHVALKDSNWTVRLAAVKKLTDQEALTQIAQKELENHIFGPKGNSGKRAANHIVEKIKEHYS